MAEASNNRVTDDSLDCAVVVAYELARAAGEGHVDSKELVIFLMRKRPTLAEYINNVLDVYEKFRGTTKKSTGKKK